jgi:CxxC motif-containing protein
MPKEETVVITCVGCPLGCPIRLTVDANGKVTEVTNISGRKCKAGDKYAIEEYKNPVRVLTATVRTSSMRHPLLAVRTSKPMLKHLLRPVMYELAKVQVKPPVKIHQVLITNVLDTGADVITSCDLID